MGGCGWEGFEGRGGERASKKEKGERGSKEDEGGFVGRRRSKERLQGRSSREEVEMLNDMPNL